MQIQMLGDVFYPCPVISTATKGEGLTVLLMIFLRCHYLPSAFVLANVQVNESGHLPIFFVFCLLLDIELCPVCGEK
jgi:hypothetical protein